MRLALQAFVEATRKNVVFRRLLRYRPAEALEIAGLNVDCLPSSLPVRYNETSVEITKEVLFGPKSIVSDSFTPWPFELRLVRYGLKPMALIHAPALDACRLLHQCRASSLFAILTPYAFDAAGDASAGGYINIASNTRPAAAELLGWRGLLVARDLRQLKLGWLSVLFHWDEFLGLLLGYPDCCVRAFRRNWEAACSSFNGEVGAALLASQSHAPVDAAHCCMNVFARYFGFHLTEHFPCGFNCQATVRIGDRLLKGLHHYEPQYAAELARMLSAPVLYVGAEGTYMFPDARWESAGTVLHYSRVLSTIPESALMTLLNTNRTLPAKTEYGRVMRFPAAA
jgi:hypothetical protein